MLLEAVEWCDETAVTQLRVGTVMALSLAVFLVLLWSWLAKDAVAHGRSRGQAAAYLVSVPTVGLGMMRYLYATRQEGMAAVMKFAGLLAACLAVMNLGELWGSACFVTTFKASKSPESRSWSGFRRFSRLRRK